MRRASLLCIAALAAVASVACSDGEAVPGSPTGPSNPPVASPPPPQPVCAPNAPANLTVTSVGTTVTLTWTPSVGATQYWVLVGTQPSNSNTLLTNTSQATHSWGGAPQGKHFARVQASNSCGTSSSSNEVEFTVSG